MILQKKSPLCDTRDTETSQCRFRRYRDGAVLCRTRAQCAFGAGPRRYRGLVGSRPLVASGGVAEAFRMTHAPLEIGEIRCLFEIFGVPALLGEFEPLAQLFTKVRKHDVLQITRKMFTAHRMDAAATKSTCFEIRCCVLSVMTAGSGASMEQS